MHTANFVVAMVEAGIVESIVNMLQSINEDIRNMAVYILSRMAEHGMIDCTCILIELTPL